MIKDRITLRDMETIRRRVIKVPYCALQWLLRHHRADMYCASNLYGWKCDIYLIDYDTAIVTGYHTGSRKRGIHPSRETIERYEQEAKLIMMTAPYEYVRPAMAALLDKFIEEVTA